MVDLRNEYILVKRGVDYYYARLNSSDGDMYIIQASVSEKEGRDIINRANLGSDYNAKQLEASQEVEQDSGTAVSGEPSDRPAKSRKKQK